MNETTLLEMRGHIAQSVRLMLKLWDESRAVEALLGCEFDFTKAIQWLAAGAPLDEDQVFSGDDWLPLDMVSELLAEWQAQGKPVEVADGTGY